MNVLVVSSWFPFPPDNGSRMRAYKLLQQLSARHRVTLLTFASPAGNEQPGPLRHLCEDVGIVPASPQRARFGWRAWCSRTPRHLVQSRNPLMEAAIASRIRSTDVAVALQLDAAPYLLPWTGVPRIFEELEVTVLLERYRDAPDPLRRARHGLTWWKFQRYVRHLVEHFDAVTVVSNTEREHLRGIGCDLDRVSVLPNGVDVPVRSSLMTERKTTRLVYPGSVTYSANYDAVQYFVREIFPIVRRSQPNVEFWVTGSTDGVDIAALKMPGVVFTGALPEVESLIEESVACVVPLRIGGGTRLKVLQAMALMTPVISTSKGVEGLEVDSERHVLLADSAAAFAAQILRLCSNPTIRQHLATDALQRVRERYTWSRIGDSLETVVMCAVTGYTVGKTAKACRNVAAL